MVKHKKILWLVVLLVFIAGCAFLGGSQGETEKNQNAAPLAVNTMRAQVSEKQQGLRLTGTVEGLTSAIISSRYSGQVEELSVENGQMVQAGTPLLRTDSQELGNNVRLAENGVRKAAVNHDNIAVNYRRQQNLYDMGAVSKQNLKAAQTQYATSQAEVDDAATNLSIAQKRLADATVTSPVTGVVANKQVTLGQMVSAGTQLMTVEQIDAVYVTVQVEQQDIDKVEIGREAKAKQLRVETGALFDDELEIKGGLPEGAMVITDNLDKLKDGDAVNAYGGEGK